ncbi:MAG: SDR family oxidoreductase [Amphritea sp.]
MFEVTGKRVLITGGASGIGFALVEHFLAAGAEVIALDMQNSDQLANTEATFITTDVTNEVAVIEAFNKATQCGTKLDVVINNAGIALHEGRFEEADLAVLEKVFSVNVKGVYLGLKYAPRHMNDGGSIINTGSAAAHVTMPEYTSYSVSKSGVLVMTKTAALQLGSRGIRVNSVSPGTVLTPMESIDGPEARISILATALERPANTSDITGAYHFLAADESRYITGSDIQVDGGWVAGMTYSTMDKVLS